MVADLDSGFTLSAESGTLSPLPDFHRKGLTAIAVLGALSFFSCGVLLLYLSYKLARWRLQSPTATGRRAEEEQAAATHDLSLGLAQKNFGRGQPRLAGSREDVGQTLREQQKSHVQEQMRPQSLQEEQSPLPVKKAPNQFLILIFNLLLADMHQATAFMLSAEWVRINGITVGIPICWAQGWFVSTGDLASSCFTGAVAIYTYLVIVRNWKPSYRLLYSAIAIIWAFIYLMAILGVAITRDGRGRGGFYVRAAAWCWVNIEYENHRLWLHYLWMFLSLALTTVLYGLIFYHLRPRSSSSSQSSSGGRQQQQQQQQDGRASSNPGPSRSHPAFLIYPIIYVTCTAPLALGRIATMAGVDVSVKFFCVAGALIASNGWLDVVLFSTTRHHILFDAPADSEDTGLDTFAFMRTPVTRRYGNMVWVQGGARTGAPDHDDDHEPRSRRRNGSSGWERIGERMGWGGGRRTGHYKGTSREWVGAPGSVSQESLRGRGSGYAQDGGIQMDTVTTVVVEVEQDKKQSRSRAPSAFSGEDSDKAFERQTGGL